MSRGVGLIAVLAPFGLILVMSLECWHLREQGRQCPEGKEVAQTIQTVTTAAFAWLATPPH